MSKIIIKYFAFIISVFIFGSCGIYSFTGASLHPNDKTVSVKSFPNRAPLVNPMLSTAFTEKVKDVFVSQTALKLVGSNGDLQFDGEITGYSTAPISITEGQRAAQTRLTISIRVKYTSINKPELNFDKTFSRYADFESTKSLSSAEAEGLPDEIIKQIVDDIFNEAVVNW
jgi:hypothetical protein